MTEKDQLGVGLDFRPSTQLVDRDDSYRGGALDGMQTGLPPQGQGPPAVHKYSFNVGSVDSFERKLEEAQEDLGWDPNNHIPVTYTNELSWSQELLRLAPTLLLIAGYVWFTRRQMGGLGGAGGPGGRGLFNVGKAQVSEVHKPIIP